MDMTGVRLTELVEAAGCAAKIAPGELAGVLSGLPRLGAPELVVGFDASDDACVWDLGDGRGLIATTDFFPPMVDDPFLFGQVAATNALSDVYAMGGRPRSRSTSCASPTAWESRSPGISLPEGQRRAGVPGALWRAATRSTTTSPSTASQ